MKGTVKWFNKEKGFGFVLGEDGIDCFVHYTDIHRTTPEKVNLDQGQTIEYDVMKTEKGWRAKNVLPA